MKRFQMCTTTKYKHNFIPSILIVISLLICILLVHTTYIKSYKMKNKVNKFTSKISYNILHSYSPHRRKCPLFFGDFPCQFLFFLMFRDFYRMICKSSKKKFAKKSLNVTNVKLLSIFFFQHFWLFYDFLVRMTACTLHIK